MTSGIGLEKAAPRLWGTRVVFGLGALLAALVGLSMTGADGGLMTQLLGQMQAPPLITALIVVSAVVMATGAIGLGRRTPSGWVLGLVAAAVVLAWMFLPALAIAWLVSFYAEVSL
jgi:heme/copper-type cytochrome/quinol oxidase subunit 3